MKLFAGENAKLNDVSNGLFSLGPTEVGWGLGWSNKYTLNNDEVLSHVRRNLLCRLLRIRQLF